MKKIFSIFASSVLALSMFVSCSGDLHNDMDPAKVALIMGETKTILDDAGIIGTINDWKNKDGVKDQGDALTKVDDTTYTYTFTAKEETEQFSIQEDREAKWSKPRWCGALKQDEDNAVKIEPKGEAAMVYSTDPNPSHFKLSKLTVGTAYKITITIVDEDKKSLKASVDVDGDAPVANTPVPFYLDSYFFMGSCLSPSGVWSPNLDYLLSDGAVDKEGNVLYALDFTAQNTSGYSCIQNKKGSLRYIGELTVGASDFIELASETDTMKSKEIKELVAGKAYRLEIKTTPEKKVYAKVYEILAYTLQLKITGFDGEDGQIALVHGTFDNWAGWSKKWGGNKKISETVTKAVIADNTAVINIYSGVAAPNEEISFTGSGYYGVVVDDYITDKSASGEIKIGGNDFNITGKITKAGTYVATLDLSEDEISEAVSE